VTVGHADAAEVRRGVKFAHSSAPDRLVHVSGSSIGVFFSGGPHAHRLCCSFFFFSGVPTCCRVPRGHQQEEPNQGIIMPVTRVPRHLSGVLGWVHCVFVWVLANDDQAADQGKGQGPPDKADAAVPSSQRLRKSDPTAGVAHGAWETNALAPVVDPQAAYAERGYVTFRCAPVPDDLLEAVQRVVKSSLRDGTWRGEDVMRRGTVPERCVTIASVLGL
jgi:hypothetical protein